ncbi:MAG TPA: triose-phosphate isomerase [Gammaproteobacteria bacterium]
MSRIPLIAGNWKMNGSLADGRLLVAALLQGVGRTAHPEMLLCPPFVYLAALADWLSGSPIALGAQNLSEQAHAGAYTGEVAGSMIKDVGCRYVIVGHSERRTLYAEDDRVVAAKFRAAQAAELVPILCVGETLAERQSGRTAAVVTRQVQAVAAEAGFEAFARAVIAYEPVWAIGTGHTATPDQAQDVHALIRGLVAAGDATIAAELKILYGGSVKGANARELFAKDDIDGGLVGGASLDAADFLKIFAAAA